MASHGGVAARHALDEHLRVPGKLHALLSWMLRVGDLALLVGAGCLAYGLRYGSASPASDYVDAIGRGVLFALIVLNSTALYRSWRGHGVGSELFKLTTLWLLMFGLMVVYAGALKEEQNLSRLWWFTWFGLSLGGAMAMRLVVRGTADTLRARGIDVRSAVVIGANGDAHRIVQTLQNQNWAGIRVHGWFSTSVDSHVLRTVPKLGDLASLAAYVEREGIDQVWIALPMSAQHKIERILHELHHSTADIKFVPDLFGMQLLNHSVEQIAGLPVINLQQTPLQGQSAIVKSIEDRVLAALILLMISPLMAVIAIAVKLSSPGPVFYRQERMSWNNKTFKMLKFRSMPVDAENKSGAVWAKAGENRATRVGAFLRRTSLDELPQFINVLKGDMSIVGPRPERPVFVHEFKHKIPAYMKKHMVKAGITGWAQVNGWRGSTDLGKRIECDLYYIDNWSLWFDIRIIFMTLFKGFVHKNA
ncbi:MAG: undecaprenyl-phosphate glucose phosphotransferase, partial [Xenophilus sp.]